MDDKLDLSPVNVQESMLQFCNDLREQEFVGDKNVKCWIENFNQWVQLTRRKEIPLDPLEFNMYLK